MSPCRTALLLVRAGRRGWDCRRNFYCLTVVDQILQFFAWLEERDLLCRNFDPVAGLWVPSHARLALARAEAAKSSDFDFVAHSQRAHHAVKDRINNHFAVFAGEFRKPGNFFDQVSLCHKSLCSVPITFSNLRGSAQVPRKSSQFPALSSQLNRVV